MKTTRRITGIIALGACLITLGSDAAGIVSVTALNSDTHAFNSGIGTFKTGDSLTVAQNATTIFPPNPYTVPPLGSLA